MSKVILTRRKKSAIKTFRQWNVQGLTLVTPTPSGHMNKESSFQRQCGDVCRNVQMTENQSSICVIAYRCLIFGVMYCIVLRLPFPRGIAVSDLVRCIVWICVNRDDQKGESTQEEAVGTLDKFTKRLDNLRLMMVFTRPKVCTRL